MDNITSALGRRENPILAASLFVLTRSLSLSLSFSFSLPAFIRRGPFFPGHEGYWITVRKEYGVPLSRGVFITLERFRWKSETKRSVTGKVGVVDGATVSGWNSRFNSATQYRTLVTRRSYVDRSFLLLWPAQSGKRSTRELSQHDCVVRDDEVSNYEL